MLNENLYRLGQKYISALGKPTANLNMSEYAIGFSWQIDVPPPSIVYYALGKETLTAVPAVEDVNTFFFGNFSIQLQQDIEFSAGVYTFSIGYYHIDSPFAGDAGIISNQHPVFGLSNTGVTTLQKNEVFNYDTPQPRFLTAFYSRYNDVAGSDGVLDMFVQFNGVIFTI